MRYTLISIYLEYVNDWLTLEAMSEHYCFEIDDLKQLIEMGKKYHEANVQRLKDIKQAK